MALNLFTVSPHLPFLEAIARGWLARGDDPLTVSRGLILLPTRRSARALADAFLRVGDGRPMLLPRIAALGALDEAPLALAGTLDLPPPVEPMQRLAALTRLILALNGQSGAPRSADRAWLLARELALLMDEAERVGCRLPQCLPDAADPEYAGHWSQILKFLHIVTGLWPDWLGDNGVMNPAARQVALLEAQARAWEDNPPDYPILIAGTTAGIPAVARLLRVVARLPMGQVVLPQLDMVMDDEAWATLEPCHAQAGLSRLLAELDATRGDVQLWPGDAPQTVPRSRFPLLSRVLLPSDALHDWLDPETVSLEGLSRLDAADQQQEAQAIALVLREALETPGAQAALVTPDRELAARVSAALLRFGIVADDSAGEKLADTPPAVFLRLLVHAVATELAPVPLLALLKHPLAAAGMSTLACREAARTLERLCLRGPKPMGGTKGLRKVVDREAGAGSQTAAFLARLEHSLEPLLRFETAMEIPAAEALAAMIESAERLAKTPDAEGPARLWANEEGEALAAHLAEVQAAVGLLPDLKRGVLPGLLDAVLEGEVVRSRRALRGRGGFEHPRIFIWGLLEARLQSVDLVVLGGLTESVWPPMPDPGPWLSRPMRTRIGLPAPEESVGQAAHDFLAACCSARRVVLSCPVRRDNAPAVPARWLTRLDMFLAGRNSVAGGVRAAVSPAAASRPEGSLSWPDGTSSWPGLSGPSPPARAATGGPDKPGHDGKGATRRASSISRTAVFSHTSGLAGNPSVEPPTTQLPIHPAVAWARALDLPPGPPNPVRPPRPCPPVHLRPRTLSVTAIETWLRDPYAIYARHILKLEALRPLEEATDAFDYGTLVHDGLHRFLKTHGTAWPADAAQELRAAMEKALAAAELRQALQAWWTPRLERIAGWVVETETTRRATRQPAAIATEVSGAIDLARPGGVFRLTCRADRIERHADGTLSILDYKTGTPPSQKEVELGLAPQLLLEAVIAAEHGFGADLGGETGELIYWHLTGGLDPGDETALFKKTPANLALAVRDARDRLCDLIDAFDQPDRAYLSCPNPGLAPRFSDYAQLARVAEWSAAGDADD
ncbi:double-strand break repair protein AddB [Rhodopila globiformis]|uniref:double-strand break repair protein AddB n=1 Tax=Rhodopila globiformis TaxID=1071 RepID=UPI0011B0511D|nr:double-strand break repair protein AddB [Rhodopila globiformis]